MFDCIRCPHGVMVCGNPPSCDDGLQVTVKAAQSHEYDELVMLGAGDQIVVVAKTHQGELKPLGNFAGARYVTAKGQKCPQLVFEKSVDFARAAREEAAGG